MTAQTCPALSESGRAGRKGGGLMAIETEIGWCDSSVNPVVGCGGCELHRAGAAESHCYAAGLVGRYKGPAGMAEVLRRAGTLRRAAR